MTDDRGLFDVLYARRSVRQYLPDPVPVADLERIVAAGLEAPSGCNAQYRRYIIITDRAVIEPMREMGRPLRTAPAIIAQLVEPKATKYGEYYLQDAAASVENMLLAAEAMGLGACWIEGSLRRHYEEICRILHIPGDMLLSALVSVGKPAESPERPEKLTLYEAVCYERYGSR